MFQKNSTAKAHMVAKAKVWLKDLVFAMENDTKCILPITLSDKASGLSTGTIFVQFRFIPLDAKLLHENWPSKLLEASKMENKYEFFNDNLSNTFKDFCQFGYVQLELIDLKIP